MSVLYTQEKKVLADAVSALADAIGHAKFVATNFNIHYQDMDRLTKALTALERMHKQHQND